MERFSYFCPCPRNLESALAEELTEIGALYSPTLRIHNSLPGGVHCSGTISDSWKINLYSRIASRVLLRLAQANYANENDIYDLTLMQPWEDWFSVDHTIRVDVTAIKSPLRSVEFTTLKIKDAVCDRFRESCHRRPFVNTQNPDIRIVGFLDARQFTLYLDTSGEPLFKRGWRIEKGDAPLRENLAAGLLRTAGWKPGIPLLDPMCGSGTILIEAAQMIAGIPPGFFRHFAFEKFVRFDSKGWNEIKSAVTSYNDVVTLPATRSLTIFGSDISGDMVAITQNNLSRAGIRFEVPLKQIEAEQIQAPSELPGMIMTNPPYGERIRVRGSSAFSNHDNDDDEGVSTFYRELATTLKRRFPGWKVFVFTADLNAPKLMRLKEARKTPFYNGPLECRLSRFDMVSGLNRR